MHQRPMIAIGGSATNPPTTGHRVLLEHVCGSGLFRKAVWIPSGTRPDKPDACGSYHRREMVELMLTPAWRKARPIVIEINYHDIGSINTPTVAWMAHYRRYYPGDTIVWYTGVDSVVPQERFGGRCEIEAAWVDGPQIMNQEVFLIVPRKGYPDPRSLTLPAQFMTVDWDIPETASSTARDCCARGEPIVGVDDVVAEYIRSHQVYNFPE